MKKRIIKSAAAVIAISVSVFAQSGDFTNSGKVVDASGQAIAMATVTYQSIGKDLSWDFSRTDGTFGTTSGIVPPDRRESTVLNFSMAGPVVLEVFAMSGKKIVSESFKNIDKGDYSLEAIGLVLQRVFTF